MDSPDETDRVLSGSERLAWDQEAVDGDQLASFHYAIYVDDVRNEAPRTSCVATTASAVFTCTSPLPMMTSGRHAIQVATFVEEAGIVRESPRSGTLEVVVR